MLTVLRQRMKPREARGDNNAHYYHLCWLPIYDSNPWTPSQTTIVSNKISENQKTAAAAAQCFTPAHIFGYFKVHLARFQQMKKPRGVTHSSLFCLLQSSLVLEITPRKWRQKLSSTPRWLNTWTCWLFSNKQHLMKLIGALIASPQNWQPWRCVSRKVVWRGKSVWDVWDGFLDSLELFEDGDSGNTEHGFAQQYIWCLVVVDAGLQASGSKHQATGIPTAPPCGGF